MSKRPREEEVEQAAREAGEAAGSHAEAQAEQMNRQQHQQQEQQQHHQQLASAYHAQFAAAGAEAAAEESLQPAQSSGSSVTVSSSPQAIHKKLKPDPTAHTSQLAALAAVAAPPQPQPQLQPMLPASPVAIKRSSEAVRNEYVKKMETFWEDQLAETQSQCRQNGSWHADKI